MVFRAREESAAKLLLNPSCEGTYSVLDSGGHIEKKFHFCIHFMRINVPFCSSDGPIHKNLSFCPLILH